MIKKQAHSDVTKQSVGTGARRGYIPSQGALGSPQPPPPPPTIHDYIAEQVSLAQTYAEDGAFFSAANVLRDLSVALVRHAEACDIDSGAVLRPKRKGKPNE